MSPRLLLLISFAIALSLGARASTPVESLTITEVMSGYSNEWNIGQGTTPLASKDGYLYWVYVRDMTGAPSQSEIVIQQRAPNGTITEQIVQQNSLQNAAHSSPSVGIDRNGYIHIFAGMHHGWLYYISDTPHTISHAGQNGPDASAFVSQAPFFKNRSYDPRTTYPGLYNDRNGVLYAVFRLCVSDNNEFRGPGSLGGILARYIESPTSNRGSWTLLGTDQMATPKVVGGLGGIPPKSLIWIDEGPTQEDDYQAMQIRLHFDATNRMHLTTAMYDKFCQLIDDGSSHIIYAYSDDGGETWHAANDKPLALPLNFRDPDAVVYFDSTRRLVRNAHVMVDDQNRPIVICHRTDQAGTEVITLAWNGSAWQRREQLNSYNSHFIGTGDQFGGFLTSVSANASSFTVRRSNDGATTVRAPILSSLQSGEFTGYNNAARISYDQNFTRDTGLVRFVVRWDGQEPTHKSRVYVLNPPNYPSTFAVPVTPQRFSATLANNGIHLSWKDRSSTETAFVLERSTSVDFTPLTTRELPADSTSAKDEVPAFGTTYHYRLRARNALGNSAPTAAVSVFVPSALAELTVTRPDASRIQLAWSNPGLPAPVVVERALGEGTLSEIARLPPGAYTYTDFHHGLDLRYRVHLLGTPAESTNIATLTSRDPYALIPGASTDAVTGPIIKGTSPTGWLTNISDGATARFDGVNFSRGTNRFTANVVQGQQGVNRWIEVYLDAIAGQPIATLPIAYTGGWGSSPVDQATNITSAVSGVRTVYLVFRGGGGVCNLRRFTFGPASDSAPAPPAAPASLTATIANGDSILSWPTSARAARYHLERQYDEWGFLQIAQTISAPATFLDPLYYGSGFPSYRVRAINGSGTSAYANTNASAAPPLSAWRYQYFGSLLASGEAGDTADPDGDGLPNLLEYALALSPVTGEFTDAPVSAHNDEGRLTLTFFRARADLTYVVQGSDTLAVDSWQDLATYGPANTATVGQEIVFTDSATLTESHRRFLRLKIAAP